MILRLLLTLALALGMIADGAAQDTFSAPKRAFDGDSTSFLPVEQAYRLTPAFLRDRLVLHWEITPGYYLYRDRFAASTVTGESLDLELPPGRVQEDAYFGRVEVYYDSVEATLADAPKSAFTLAVTSQGCADAGLCYPPHTEQWRIDPASKTAQMLQVAAAPAVSSPTTATGMASAGASWPLMALLALAGGALLNLMPCVFPVLGLKALSFQHTDGKPVAHGASYTAGVVASFLALAALLLALREAGLALGWGFQLQQPPVVAALAYLFVALGLSLSGLWSFGTRLMGVGQRWTEHQGLAGSFFTGVLATVVASPCTAPLMGTAMGFALLQPTLPALGLFAALGLGMALPLLVLSASPQLLRLLPRPGPWMERFRQALAFPLYASAIWLCWVIGRQAGANAMALTLVGCLLVALGLWLVRFALVSRLLAVACLGLALGLLANPQFSASPTTRAALAQGVVPYSAARLAELRAAGTPVMLNATADWCLTCLANEQVALSSDQVQKALQDAGFIYMVADWTYYDPAITRLLADFDRGGVPLYVLFPPNSAPQVLPQLLTPALVVKAIEDTAFDQVSQQ